MPGVTIDTGPGYTAVNDELQPFSKALLLDKQRYPPKDEEDALVRMSFQIKNRQGADGQAQIKLSLPKKAEKEGVSMGLMNVHVHLAVDGECSVLDEKGNILASTGLPKDTNKVLWRTSTDKKWSNFYVCAIFGRLVIGSGSFFKDFANDFDPHNPNTGEMLIWHDDQLGYHGVPSLFSKIQLGVDERHHGEITWRIYSRDWWDRLKTYEGVAKPWWDRLCDKEQDAKKKKQTQDKQAEEIRQQLRARRPQRWEEIADPVPLCVGDPYQDPGEAAVMSRHRGHGFSTKGNTTGKQPDTYLHYEAGSASQDVADPYIDVIDAERKVRLENIQKWNNNTLDKRTGSYKAPRVFVSSHANDRGRQGATGVLGEIFPNAWSEVTAADDQNAVRRKLESTKTREKNRKQERNTSLRDKAENIIKYRNIQTNPTKKGSFGVAGTLMDDAQLRHMPEPCTEDAMREVWLREQAQKRAARGDRASFRPSGKRDTQPGTNGPWKGGTFSSVEQAFGDTRDIAEALRRRNKEFKRSDKNPERPQSAHAGNRAQSRASNRPKSAGGVRGQTEPGEERPPFRYTDKKNGGCINAFPEFVPDPYPDRAAELRLKRAAKMKATEDAGEERKSWVPNRHGSKGAYGTPGMRLSLRFVK